MSSRSTSEANFLGQGSKFANKNIATNNDDSNNPVTIATGGTKATPGDGYVYHLFTSPGTFNITGAGPTPINLLVVGGGGGGGYDRGGGGGFAHHLESQGLLEHA